MGIRLAIAAAALFALVGIVTAHNANVRREAVITERASVEKQAQTKDAKAQANRRAAAASDTVRLLESRGEFRDEPKP